MKPLKQTLVLSLLVCVVFVATVANGRAGTLDDVKARGAIRCGVHSNLAGFARQNNLGEYTGFDVDICRAVASALFNDSEAVDMFPLSSTDRLLAVQNGQIDILSRNTTWTLERNALFGEFAGVNFYDGQGFMAPKSSGYRSALELDNQPVCVTRNTTSELNAADFFSVSDMRYRPVYYDDEVDAISGYIGGACKAFTTDRSGLAAQRSAFEDAEAHIIMPEVISKEPLGPVVPLNDSEWANVVRWSLNCMINAEELGVNSRNIDEAGIGATPAIRRLIGAEGDTGIQLGLDPQWCSRIIRQVGNYGEVYDRHIGPDTPIGLPRRINALWSDGGLIYAPPIR
ncbi:MAG: amino acid ABC transporter substrate-binding protein [Granulosicoccus sp.]